MTQKFHENETATIALYKYHELLKCEDVVAKLRRGFPADEMAAVEARLNDDTYFASDISYSIMLVNKVRQLLSDVQ